MRLSLFEVALEGCAGVVDEHVDPAEPLHRSVGGRLGFVDIGDVEPDGVKAVRPPEDRCDLVGATSGGDDRVAGCQRRLGECDAHAATGTGDHPHSSVGHHASVRSVAPRREPVEGGLGWGAGFGGVDDEGLGDVAGEVEGFVVEVEVADEFVVEVLGAAAVLGDVVGGPHASEVVAAHRQLADELGEVAVVGVAGGFGAQAADGG